MKRILFDVPRWHVFLHRDARGLPQVEKDDAPHRQLEDELFDRLYVGESERIAKPTGKLAAWAERVHDTCSKLPAFERLSKDCLGDADAAALAVETLMTELAPHLKADEINTTDGALRRTVTAACEKSAERLDELREAKDALGQTCGTGNSGHIAGADKGRWLAQRLVTDERLKRIALLAGRFKRIAAQKQRSKARHGMDELVDIELGGNVERLVPSELGRLAHPKLRLAMRRDLIEKVAMQYRLEGTGSLGKGPLVVCLDKSGSMNGPADVWATAVVLALLDIAQRQNRAFAVLPFNGTVHGEFIAEPGSPLPGDVLFLECAGGTDIGGALHQALNLVRTHPGRIKKADVVIVTDGQSDPNSASALRDLAAELGVTTLGVGIGVEKDDLKPWCDEVQSIRRLDTIDDATAETLFTI